MKVSYMKKCLKLLKANVTRHYCYYSDNKLVSQNPNWSVCINLAEGEISSTEKVAFNPKQVSSLLSGNEVDLANNKIIIDGIPIEIEQEEHYEWDEPDSDELFSFTVDAKTLAAIFKKSSKIKSDVHFNGANFFFNDKKMTVVTTDAKVALVEEVDVEVPKHYLRLQESVVAVLSHLDVLGTDKVTVSVREKNIVFESKYLRIFAVCDDNFGDHLLEPLRKITASLDNSIIIDHAGLKGLGKILTKIKTPILLEYNGELLVNGHVSGSGSPTEDISMEVNPTYFFNGLSLVEGCSLSLGEQMVVMRNDSAFYVAMRMRR